MQKIRFVHCNKFWWEILKKKKEITINIVEITMEDVPEVQSVLQSWNSPVFQQIVALRCLHHLSEQQLILIKLMFAQDHLLHQG